MVLLLIGILVQQRCTATVTLSGVAARQSVRFDRQTITANNYIMYVIVLYGAAYCSCSYSAGDAIFYFKIPVTETP